MQAQGRHDTLQKLPNRHMAGFALLATCQTCITPFHPMALCKHWTTGTCERKCNALPGSMQENTCHICFKLSIKTAPTVAPAREPHVSCNSGVTSLFRLLPVANMPNVLCTTHRSQALLFPGVQQHPCTSQPPPSLPTASAHHHHMVRGAPSKPSLPTTLPHLHAEH
jgi:hypothetical protein